MSSFKSNENIHKKEDGSYNVVTANKVGFYCYLATDILTEHFIKYLLSSPQPSIKKLYKFLILFCCFGN